MKITFFSNFLNHHQLPFCQEMVKIFGDDFKFVATEKIPEERLSLGYEDMNEKYDFVVCSYKDEKKALKLGDESDIVIIGSAPDKYIRKRLRQKKLVFRYSERIFRDGIKLRSFLSVLLKRTILERNNTYLLCASAYSSYDFNLVGAYKNKCFKWGYFPKTIEYKDINEIINNKNKNKILWVGRMLELKHPEVLIDVAKSLKQEKYDFEIDIIGEGELQEKIELMIKDNRLENNIKLLGTMSPSDVRKQMLESEIFLFTSDKNEGWGAVLNEAMNSACAVIASDEIGSVPFLINNNENGLIYKSGDTDELISKVKYIIDNKEVSKNIGIEAYNTMIKLWNPKIAAERLIELSKLLINKEKFNKYKDGPCSIAENLKDNWYINNREEK